MSRSRGRRATFQCLWTVHSAPPIWRCTWRRPTGATEPMASDGSPAAIPRHSRRHNATSSTRAKRGWWRSVSFTARTQRATDPLSNSRPARRRRRPDLCSPQTVDDAAYAAFDSSESWVYRWLLDEQERRALQVALQRLHELGGVLSVDRSVVERRRQVHQAPRHDRVHAHDWSLDDAV